MSRYLIRYSRILCLFIALTLLLTGCIDTEAVKKAFHEDHGELIDIEVSTPLYTQGDASYDGQTIDSGDFHIKCMLIYEDGCEEETDDWTMDAPVTLDCTKENVITIHYEGFEKTVTVGPTEKFNPASVQKVSNSSISELQKNTMLAETIIEQYPGHGTEYYLDLLIEEGLSQNEAIAALNAAGY